MTKHLILNYPKKEQNGALTKLLPNYFTGHLGGGGQRTNFDLHRQGIKEVDELATWIRSTLPEVASHFARLKGGEKCNFNVEGLNITHMWGVLYDKGEGVDPHNHFPFALSCVYYIRTPKGCSPLTLDNIKIKIRAGQCVFFLGSSWHSVARAAVKGRCVISTNILYHQNN